MKIALLALWLASAADLGTTEYGLRHGLEEANPIHQQTAARYVSHLAVPLVFTFAARKHPHSKPLLITAVVVASMYAAAAGHNFYLEVKLK